MLGGAEPPKGQRGGDEPPGSTGRPEAGRGEGTYGLGGGTGPPIGRRGVDEPPASTGPPEAGRGGFPTTAEFPTETGGGAETRADAVDEPPRNREGDETGGPTPGRPPPREGPSETPAEGPLETPTEGAREAEGERYAAMKAVLPKVLSVGDGARRPARRSRPEDRR